jgi:hypothetical protein
MPMTTCDQKTFHKESKRKKRLKSKMIVGICLVIYTLLLPIIGYGLQRFSPLRDILGCDRLEKKNNQSIEIIQRLKDQIKQLDEKSNYYIVTGLKNFAKFETYCLVKNRNVMSNT